METQENSKQKQNITLDRKSKILFAFIGVLIAGSVVVTFWRYMIKRDYIVQAQTDCDPTTENCFIWKCDPNATDATEKCTGDPEKDTWYYKIIHRNARNIPNCDPNDKNCTALTCYPGEKDCSEELCTAQNVKAPDTCNDPVQYNIDNPPEQSTDCAPDDQACLDAQSQDQSCAPDDPNCSQTQDTGDNPDTNKNTNSDSSDQLNP